jgi:hypothetical protein
VRARGRLAKVHLDLAPLARETVRARALEVVHQVCAVCSEQARRLGTVICKMSKD